jgi:Holliday junction resolvase
MKNYVRGYNLEYKTKKMLESAGYMVFRSPASKSPADVIAFNREEKLMVQCKKSSKDVMYVYGLDELVESAERYGAKPLLVYSFYYSPVFVKELSSGNEKFSKDGENVEFGKYLRLR